MASAVGRWSPQAAAIVAAIVIGDRTGLADEAQRRLQEAGTSRVIAISGGNIAILAGLTLGLFRVAGLLTRTARPALVGAIAALVAYGYLVGGGASVDRASTLMAVVFLPGRALDLRGPPLNTLALVAGLLVAADPLTIADPAFLLTFGATAAILVAVPSMRSARMPRAFAPVVAMFAASAAAPTGQPQTTKPEQFGQLRWDHSQKGREIDLGQYKRTFHDDFKTMDIVKDNSDPGPGAVWFSPGHGAFRKNSPLRADGPFKLVDDGVRLRVEKVGKRWLGACMTTVNTKGEGFAQQYGYFEMTAEYNYPPPGPKRSRIWGAYWLKSQGDYFNNGTTTRTEIDINEFYGDDGYHVTGHLWPAAHLSPDATITKHISCSGYKNKVAPDLFKNLKVDGVVRGFHCYGSEITPQWVIMYFDHKEQSRFPTMEEWKTPLYMLVDLVITKSEEEAVFPMDLTVKNVSAYQPIQPYKGQ